MTFFLVIADVIKQDGIFLRCSEESSFREASGCRVRNSLDSLAYVLSHQKSEMK